ncbi:hypothetical protein G6F22_009648 [Rhizopus arrhizus]|nr:hypothetical protein G6F22_009648 [Rhizopus arrhizus]
MQKKGFDPELLAMIPQPVQAIIFLFPITDIYEKFKDEEEAHLIKCEQAISPDVIFFKQTISNACGMMAILHSIASNDKELIGPGLFNDIIEEAKNMSIDERVDLLENSKELAAVHQTAAFAGQTEAPDKEEEIDLHFICFIEVDNHLYELDGRKILPINHGKCTDLIESSVKVMKQHLSITHKFESPNRVKTVRQHNNESFWYLNSPSNEERVNLHYTCPCCAAHFGDLNALDNHFNDDHKEYLPPRSQYQSQPSTLNSSSFDDQHTQGQKRSHDELVSLDGFTFGSPDDDHLLADNFDVTDAFCMMRLSLKNYKWKMSLEDHLHLALASTSILFLSPSRYLDEVKPLPETVQDPLSFLLNKAPTRIPCFYYSASPWFIRWPVICTMLYELDYLFHDKDRPSPPFQLGQRFLDWLLSPFH